MQVSVHNWKGSRAVGPGSQKSGRSPEEMELLKKLSCHSARAASDKGWSVTAEERAVRWIRA